MNVAITGASGFIGTPLVRRLQDAGHTVLTIGRAHGGSPPDIVWDAATSIDAARLDGVDAVVHLAGESIAQRWTSDAKRRIRDSRVQGTSLLARTLAALPRRPRVLVSMSAIGIYGNRGDDTIDESSPIGRGFLAEIGAAWEGSADAARAAGIRVVHPRLGIVLSPEGGALGKMLPIFSLGAGGKIGSGRQWMSWISRTDTLRALEFLVTSESLEGAVNLTAPAPVTNAEFTSVLGKALHRPTIAPVPEFAIKLLYGEMGEATVIEGQKVLPKKLLEAGFEFSHKTLPAALEAEGVR
jgi:uncharacterized protein (TIGR01777 family)